MGSLEDYHFLGSFKGKRIKLTTKGSAFVGVVQHINLNRTIVLVDVVEANSGTKLFGAKLFFGYEILNIEFPSEPGDDAVDKGEQSQGQLTVAEFQPYRTKLFLEEDKDEQCVDYVVIDKFQEKFGPALMHIRKQQVIGLGADGIGTFHHERLCWLQIATKHKIYLFDILLLGGRAFKNGLSKILEGNHILKVVHDCRRIGGCLMAQFGVNLTNVFDTQVADVLCFYTETGGFLPDRVSTLEEVVSLHLKMPLSDLSSLNIKDQLAREDQQVWSVRPCPAPLLKVMTLSVIHLQLLRIVLLDVIMSDYTNLVDSYLSSGKGESVNVQCIASSEFKLPKELQELEVSRAKRQQWALSHYPVTKDGLLRRYFNPSSKSDKQQPKHSGLAEPSSPRSMPDEPQTHGSPDHLPIPPNPIHEAADFTALGRGRPPYKETGANTTTFTSLGRGHIVHMVEFASEGHIQLEQNVEKPSPDEPLRPGLSLQEGGSEHSKPSQDDFPKSEHSATAFPALARGRSPYKENVSSAAFPGFGRGHIVSAAVLASGGSVQPKMSVTKTTPDVVD